MSLADMFKSKAELLKESRRKAKKAIRNLERSLENVSDLMESFEKKRDEAWAQARKYLLEGQKTTSDRYLKTVHDNLHRVNQLEKRRWLMEQYVVDFNIAMADMDLAESLGGLTKVGNFDFDKLRESFDNAAEVINDKADIDKLYDKEIAKRTGKMESSATISSMDELRDALGIEVAAAISSGKSVIGKATESGREKI